MLNHVDFNRHMTDIEYRLETREVRGAVSYTHLTLPTILLV